MSNPNETQETVTLEEHSSPIKTPKQLVVVVILSFIVPVVGIILLASWVTSGTRPSAGSTTLTAEATALRIAPVARIEIVDVSAPAELRSGEAVYTLACAACHDAGVAGAYKFADQVAWAPVIATGLDSMVANVISGKGAMPARGGNPTLDDLEIARAVVYMSNAAGADFPEPSASDSAQASAPPEATVAAAPAMAAAAPQPAEPEQPKAEVVAADSGVDLALGERIYNQACFACHNMGVAGAPKFGDKAAWSTAMAGGMESMIANTISGKGAMPARGGVANASDADIAAAVHYMVNAVQ
jgi:cytochrome c5